MQISMPRHDRTRMYAGWSAYISAAISIIGAVALLLFYALEAPRILEAGDSSGQLFGPLSDYAGLFQFLFMLPLTPALYRLALARNERLSRFAQVLGVAGLLTAAIAQALLVAHIIAFTVNLPVVLVGMVLIGVWIVMANRLGRIAGALTHRLSLLGAFTGAMFALLGSLTLLFVVINAINPTAMANLGTTLLHNPILIGVVVIVFTPALLAYMVGVPIWLIGLGRLLLAPARVAAQ